MDKLIKAIPKDHMDIISIKAETEGVSTSSYIRELIRKDVGVSNLHVRDIPYATAQKIRCNAAASGLTVRDLLLKLLLGGGVNYGKTGNGGTVPTMA